MIISLWHKHVRSVFAVVQVSFTLNDTRTIEKTNRDIFVPEICHYVLIFVSILSNIIIYGRMQRRDL